jgi:hypothetical protein
MVERDDELDGEAEIVEEHCGIKTSYSEICKDLSVVFQVGSAQKEFTRFGDDMVILALSGCISSFKS